MFIKEIKLENFRNYDFTKIELNEKTNIFFGDNAQGKTNILEAIFFAGLGKSFRTNKEKELIKENKDNGKIEIKFIKNNREEKINVEINDRKKFFINEIPVRKLSEIIGKINIVLFNPEDIEILKNEPTRRRKFLNIMISQLRPKYIYLMSEYSKALEQRNNYLKQIKFENKPENMLDIWDEKLVDYGIKIYEYRNEFIEKIQRKIKNIHFNITQEKENIEIKYFSDASTRQNFINELKSKRKIDIVKGFTTKGVHHDDFLIYLNDKQVNIYGSQGQHRTAMLSLKLSELQVIYDDIGEYPILLLDDFMSELDEKRRKNFLENIKNIQVIITCTDKIVLENLNYFLYNVVDGKIIEKEK